MKITLYELLGLIKDYNAPKKVEYEDTIYELDKNIMNYWYEKGRSYLFDGCLSHLNDKVTIIPTILDDAERKYLRGVIEPFKEKVEYISKKTLGNKEFIGIYLINNDFILFPYFKKGKMYKGMKVNRKYSLEELGL